MHVIVLYICMVSFWVCTQVSEHWVQNIMLNKTQKINSMKHNAEAARYA